MENCKSKFTSEDNNVSSANQLKASSRIFFLGNENAKKHILIVGNSITRHGPKPDIGWHSDFGMAASAIEKDYVHLLCADILAKEDAYIMVHQLADWERAYTEEDSLSLWGADRAFKPDLLIFRLGENMPSLKTNAEKEALETALVSVIKYLSLEEKQIIFTTCFWKHGVVDEAIRSVAKRMHAPLVELGDLGDDDKFMAVGLFEHVGVAHHPGDLGMQTIAERIYCAIQEL